jgi:uncharacterized SAM-binding protein YcdF (DUF218 family)
MEGSVITSPQLMARIVGFLYLFIIIGALVAPFAAAPSGMMRENAASPNAAKILASPSVYFLFPYIMWPGGFAELLLTLWLLARGVKVQRWEKMSEATWKLRIAP